MKEEIVVIGYFNVLFRIKVKSEFDKVKIGYLIERIKAGERMFMRDLRDWCNHHNMEYQTQFRYRKDFPLKANLWNLYSFVRFSIKAD